MPATGRSLQDFDELFPAELALLRAAQDGLLCCLSNYQSSRPEAKTDQNFVRASFVCFLALGGDADHPVHEKGVRLECAWIGAAQEGGKDLDLAGQKDIRPLFLYHCRFEGNIVLEDACTRTISLDYSIVDGGIKARGALINGSLYLRHLDNENTGFLQVRGGINLVDATIKGSFECVNAKFFPRKSRFGTETGATIFATRVNISGSVFLQGTFSAEGATVFRNAKIGGNFECSGGIFGTDERPLRAIDCLGAQIGGGVLFRSRDIQDKDTNFKAYGEICFIDARIGGSFECHGADIRNLQGNALICSRANIAGTVFLHEGFSGEGSVIFRDAIIGGHLDCSGSSFRGCASNVNRSNDRLAIDCQGAKIGGSVFLRKDETGKSFKAKGLVRFIGADVAGSFECHSAVIENQGTEALVCSRIKVGRSILLIDGFSAQGAVSFRQANVGGNFDASNATFVNISDQALSCENIHIIGHALLGISSSVSRENKEIYAVMLTDNNNKHFKAFGGVNFTDAHIEGDFRGTGGLFVNSTLNATSLSGEPRCNHALQLRNAVISGALRLEGKDPRQKYIWGSLDLSHAKVTLLADTEASWPPKEVSEGFVPSGCETAEHVTAAASAGKDKLAKLQCHILLDGFAYDRIQCDSLIDAAMRYRWLQRQPDYRPQPFEQLIRMLRATGQEDESRQIAMFKQQSLQPLRVRQAAPWQRPFVWCIGILWGLFAGYGYRPHRLVVSLIALWLSSAVIYQMAAAHGGFVPNDPQVWNSDLRAACEQNWTTCDKVRDIMGFNALTYSADVLLPVIDLRQRSVWIPKDGWIRMVTWAENILGSLGALLLGAILGGIVKQD